jgi:hypothetical protein
VPPRQSMSNFIHVLQNNLLDGATKVLRQG